jgi:hypothetical protein
MSILCVNEDPCGDYLVWRFEVGEFFPWGWEWRRKSPRKRFGDEEDISSSAVPENY